MQFKKKYRIMKNLRTYDDLAGSFNISYKEFSDNDSVDIFKSVIVKKLETNLKHRMQYIFSHLEEYPEFKKYKYLHDKMTAFLVYSKNYVSRAAVGSNEYEIMCEFSDAKYDVNDEDIDYLVRFFINVDTLEYKVDIEISYHHYSTSDVISVESGVLSGDKVNDMLLVLFRYCDDPYKKFN
jgi:hypothetical protein